MKGATLSLVCRVIQYSLSTGIKGSHTPEAEGVYGVDNSPVVAWPSPKHKGTRNLCSGTCRIATPQPARAQQRDVTVTYFAKRDLHWQRSGTL